MIKVGRIISGLELTKERPAMYVQPLNAECLLTHLIGLKRGVFLSIESLTFGDFVKAGCDARRIRGWQRVNIIDQMRAKSMSEDAIIQELLEIDIQKWKILEKSENAVADEV